MRNHSLVTILMGVLLLPAVCSAQRAAAWRDSTRRLDVAVHALRDSLLQSDSSAVEVARRGDLAIAASANQSGNAIDALDRFIAARDRHFSGEMPASGGFRIVIRTGYGASNSPTADDERGAVVLSGLPDTGNSVRSQRTGWASNVATALIDQYGEMMIASVPTLATWTRNPPPLSMDEGDRRDQAMYAFVTAMGPAQRKCVAGDLAACRIAIGVARADAADTDRVFGPFMRTDLLYFALDLGGAGAWSRLRDASDSGVGPMLSAAARMPADSVLARWRNGLLALRPATAVLTIRSALIAITWTAMLLLAALGASKWA